MNYNYPQVGKAAVELLEAAGLRVVLANGGCCGRPMISKGMLDEASAHARANVDLLSPYAEQGIPIIGCEPSCLLTFRDEYPELVKNDKAQKVAENSFLIDEYLTMLAQKGELKLEFKDAENKILFHGHCHQKAFDVMSSVQQVLALIPELEVETIKSSCCGMAGAFGYDAKHYETSMKMGELNLLPAVRAADEDSLIIADGTSCRNQIRDGTGREAMHVARVLEMALSE